MQQSEVALVHVTVIPMDSDRILVHQNVVVNKGRIVSVSAADKVAVGDAARRIDGKDRYLMWVGVRPFGFAEMRMHVRQPWQLLLLAYGVTPVRNMFGNPSVLESADAVNASGAETT